MQDDHIDMVNDHIDLPYSISITHIPLKSDIPYRYPISISRSYLVTLPATTRRIPQRSAEDELAMWTSVSPWLAASDLISLRLTALEGRALRFVCSSAAAFN